MNILVRITKYTVIPAIVARIFRVIFPSKKVESNTM